MSDSARRSALAALDGARPAIARLDAGRNPEDVAADMIEGWGAVETALRTLVGGSALAGQALIREARQRQLISLDQANSLAEFAAARDRLQRTEYRPADGDVNAARAAFLKLESGLMAAEARGDVPGSAVPPAFGAADATTGTTTAPTVPATTENAVVRRGRPRWLVPLVAVLALALVAGIAWWALAGRETALDRGIAYYRAGQREAAVAEFQRAAREDAKDPIPHVYLSRMAREVGNLTLAHQEAQAAVNADPNNALALREMGSYLLTAGNYELARRFYVRALQGDASDRASMGWLGCALVRLNRIDEGMRWMNRAGQGGWSSCAPLPPGAAPGIPGQQPYAPQP